MKEGLRLIGALLLRPRQAPLEDGFDRLPFALWFWAQAPMLVILTVTGMLDPAPGLGADGTSLLIYLFGACLVCAFSMLLGLARSFLLMWAGGQRMSFGGAARALLPLNCLYALLEAAYTLALFALRGALGATPYRVAEQLCLFGLELWYAACAALVLYQREQAGKRRSLAVGLGCFLLSSGWLLLNVLLG